MDPSQSLNIEISKKKPSYPVKPLLAEYLKRYQRFSLFGLGYDDLTRWDTAFPVNDIEGNDTLWRSVLYSRYEQDDIFEKLLHIYANITADNVEGVVEHLKVESVDYCLFGNSNPFRIKIRNLLNDNYDYYYVKKADASRVYGLELEEMLSPNKIFYLCNEDTLVEQHISGIPGDQFLGNYFQDSGMNAVRLAKEFVKFNERCFVRLLGDMRAYNFVVDVTPDFDQMQYRIRAIDFDQQSFEGNCKIYLPQFYKENTPYVQMALDLLGHNSRVQYQKEERTLMRRRVGANRYQLQRLIKVMRRDEISTPEKLKELKYQLADYHHNKSYLRLKNMGAILFKQLNYILELNISPMK